MKTLRRLLFSVAGAGRPRRRDARRHQLLLRRRRRHGLRPLPRDPAHGRRLGGLQPPRREVQGLPRQLLLGRPAHAREEPLSACGCTRAASRRSRSTSGTRTSCPSSSAAARATARSAPTGRAGPHGAPYAALFINPEHNANQQLMDDCLRCHAMHFEGGIRDLVTPLDRKGPWTFVKEEYAGLPAVPCLACHSVHRKGEPLAPRSDRGLVAGPAQEIVRPSLALYDRRALEHVGLDRLPMPAMKDGDRPVKVEPRPAAGALLPVPRAPGGDAGLLRRRPHAGGCPRGAELPGLPREARPDDPRLVRGLPPAPLELRDRRGDDGHDLQVARQPARRPPRGVPRLPPEGRAEEADDAGGKPRHVRLEVDAFLDEVVGAGPDLLEHGTEVLAEDPEEEQLGAADEAEDRQGDAPRRRRPLAQPPPQRGGGGEQRRGSRRAGRRAPPPGAAPG